MQEFKHNRLKTNWIPFFAFLILLFVYQDDLKSIFWETFTIRKDFYEIMRSRIFVAFFAGYVVMGIVADVICTEHTLKTWGRIMSSSRRAGLNDKFSDNKWRGHFAWASRRIGIIERVFYTSAIAFNQFALIGVWLVFKAIGDWKDGADSRKTNSKVTRIRANMFLIGSGYSLAWGILGGIVFKLVLDPNYILKLIQR